MSTTSEEARHCTMLNNLGVDIMLFGDFDLAISTLRECMTIARNALKRANPTERLAHQKRGVRIEDPTPLMNTPRSRIIEDWFAYASTVFDNQPMSALEDTTVRTTTMDDLEDDNSSNFFICRSPISIPEDETIPSVTPVHAIVIVYNMALCYHLYGLVGDRTNACVSSKITTGLNPDLRCAMLTTAASLYRLCEEMVRLDGIRASNLFCMTLANNLGSLHSTMGSNDRAKHCFQYVLSLQIMLVDRNNSHPKDATRQDVAIAAIDGFWFNTSRLVLAKVAASTA